MIFTPSVDIKRALHDTAINITCYNRNGKVIKNVTSGDGGDVEDPDNTEEAVAAHCGSIVCYCYNSRSDELYGSEPIRVTIG